MAISSAPITNKKGRIDEHYKKSSKPKKKLGIISTLKLNQSVVSVFKWKQQSRTKHANLISAYPPGTRFTTILANFKKNKQQLNDFLTSKYNVDFPTI